MSKERTTNGDGETGVWESQIAEWHSGSWDFSFVPSDYTCAAYSALGRSARPTPKKREEKQKRRFSPVSNHPAIGQRQTICCFYL